MKAKLSNFYVVVNVSGPADLSMADGEFFVMPGESPRTYPSLEAAVGCKARLMLEYGHSIDTVPVYRLAVVPDEEVRPLLEEALARLKGEQEKMFDDD